jgi:16S rRNA processing protein RimM
MADLVVIGRIARAHGNKGQVIVNLETDFPEERFRAGEVVIVGDEVSARTIRGVRFHQGRPVIALEGVDTMDDAEALAGAELKIAASGREPLPDGTFYHADLIGCEVRDDHDALVGTVTKVEGTLAMSRLVVAGARSEVLIPLVADICVGIDIASRRIVVRLPDGLIELNETTRSRS